MTSLNFQIGDALLTSAAKMLTMGFSSVTNVRGRAADPANFFLQLAQSRCDQNAAKSSWDESWFGSATKSDGCLLLVRHPAPQQFHNKKVDYRKQIMRQHSCHQIFGQDRGRSRPRKNILSSSLIIKQKFGCFADICRRSQKWRSWAPRPWDRGHAWLQETCISWHALPAELSHSRSNRIW